ncbi:MAG: Flagellar basal-body rod protein FlgG [Syntrophus sp. SKADARSKE-3]|nr:Flagellar basal-body rod protein FlgG [Syntrophus sp. SKADARSKE-3]
MGYGINETADVMGRMVRKLDHVSANLSNASTTGYKTEHLYATAAANRPQAVDNEVPLPPTTVAVDFSKGIKQQTGNTLDLMIESEGFFAVKTKNGTAYTRRGDFTISGDSKLVTQLGEEVLGNNGNAITINGQSISVGRDGTIKVDDGEVGKLKIVSFADTATLTRGENGYFTSTAEPTTIDRPGVVQGAIEMSNVNVIKEMVDMIDIQRSFEVYQKVIQTITDQDKISTARIGRLV